MDPFPFTNFFVRPEPASYRVTWKSNQPYQGLKNGILGLSVMSRGTMNISCPLACQGTRLLVGFCCPCSLPSNLPKPSYLSEQTVDKHHALQTADETVSQIFGYFITAAWVAIFLTMAYIGITVGWIQEVFFFTSSLLTHFQYKNIKWWAWLKDGVDWVCQRKVIDFWWLFCACVAWFKEGCNPLARSFMLKFGPESSSHKFGRV